MEAQNSIWTEIGVHNCIVTLCAVVLILTISVKIVKRLFRCVQQPSKIEYNSDSIFGQCKFPDCVRCRRRADVLMRARTKLTYYDENQKENPSSSLALLLKDVQYSYHKLTELTSDLSSENFDFSSQNALVFRLRGIQCQSVWNSEDFSGLGALTENWIKIRTELYNLLESSKQADKLTSGLWKSNRTPSGRWSICHLVDQGVVKTEMIDWCPETWRIVSGLPGVMKNNLFGNVAFSVVEPGTKIEPHFGPTNIRIRCHLGLCIPSDCSLTVGDSVLQWTEGNLLCFDETYLHGVQHDGTEGNRAVLIVDLWHPTLTEEQRCLINYAFSPMPVAEGSL